MRVFALLMLALLLANPAFADTDQHCLSQCVASGAGGSSCLKQCSYNIDTKPKTVPIPEITLQDLEAHRELPVPMPVTGDVLPKPHKPTVAAPQKDMACVAECLHEGLQYGLCNEKCVKAPCPTGAILCKKDQTAFSPPSIHN